jgi:hypothetical protein
MKFGDLVEVRQFIVINNMARNIKSIQNRCMVLKNLIFGKIVGSVSTITNCIINAQFVNNTLIIVNLINKDDVTSFVGRNQDIFLM